jgi:hypothetical protein
MTIAAAVQSAHWDGAELCVLVGKSSVNMSALARTWRTPTRELWTISLSHLNCMDMDRDSLEFFSL